MKSYVLSFHEHALEDIKKLKKSDKSAFKKLGILLEELRTHPYSGTGKAEI